VDCRQVSFELGKIRILAEYGKDIVLFTNGFVVNRVLSAAEALNKQGVRATVADVHTIKPLDRYAVAALLEQTGAAVTIEDHNIIGGLGSAIAELSVEECPIPIRRLGLQDCYPRSGMPDLLLDYYRIGVSDIITAALDVLKRKSV
jgi:transketolase